MLDIWERGNNNLRGRIPKSPGKNPLFKHRKQLRCFMLVQRFCSRFGRICLKTRKYIQYKERETSLFEGRKGSPGVRLFQMPSLNIFELGKIDLGDGRWTNADENHLKSGTWGRERIFHKAEKHRLISIEGLHR